MGRPLANPYNPILPLFLSFPLQLWELWCLNRVENLTYSIVWPLEMPLKAMKACSLGLGWDAAFEEKRCPLSVSKSIALQMNSKSRWLISLLQGIQSQSLKHLLQLGKWTLDLLSYYRKLAKFCWKRTSLEVLYALGKGLVWITRCFLIRGFHYPWPFHSLTCIQAERKGMTCTSQMPTISMGG